MSPPRTSGSTGALAPIGHALARRAAVKARRLDRDVRLFLICLVGYSILWVAVHKLGLRKETAGLFLTAAIVAGALYLFGQALFRSIYRCVVGLALLSGSEFLFIIFVPHSRWLFVK